VDPDDLSQHGRLLLDYARQVAKRSSQIVVQPVHVALAAFEREPDRAESELGAGTRDQLLHVAEQLTQGPAVIAIADETFGLLRQIKQPGDEWPLLREVLPAVLSSRADSPEGPEPTDPGAPEAGSGPSVGAVAPAAAPSTPPDAAEDVMGDVLGRLQAEPLVSAIRALDLPPGIGGRWNTEGPVVAALLSELWALSTWLLGPEGWQSPNEVRAWFSLRSKADPPTPAVEAHSGLGSLPESLGASSPIFAGLVARDVRQGTDDALRYAREIIKAARVICLADNHLSMDEARRIDVLRVDLRTALTHTTATPESVVGDAGVTTPQLMGAEVHAVGGSATPEPVRAAMEELEDLVGLGDIKAEVRSFVDLAWMNTLRADRGQPAPAQNLNMAFLGNPGTGKTTVARLVGRILAGLGILGHGQLVEIDRSQLIAKYVGQTAPMVHELMERARGGVVFIDEAYSLTPSADTGGYENEAITTLVKLMEDLRSEVVVIVAGYPDLMEQFLASNPGLQSRIATVLQFPDYNTDELMKIFDHLCAESGRTCPSEARHRVRIILDVARRRPRCGNGRDVRNLIEALERNQAMRLAGIDADFITDAELASFVLADVPNPPPTEEEPRLGTYL